MRFHVAPGFGNRCLRVARGLAAVLGLIAGPALAGVQYAVPPSFIIQTGGQVIVDSPAAAAAGYSWGNGQFRAPTVVPAGNVPATFKAAAGAAGFIGRAARAIGPVGVAVSTAAWLYEEFAIRPDEAENEWVVDRLVEDNRYSFPAGTGTPVYHPTRDAVMEQYIRDIWCVARVDCYWFVATSPADNPSKWNAPTGNAVGVACGRPVNSQTYTCTNVTVNSSYGQVMKPFPATDSDWGALDGYTREVPDDVLGENDVKVTATLDPSTFIPVGNPYPAADPSAPWIQPGYRYVDRPLTADPWDVDEEQSTRPADNPDTPEDESPAPDNPGTPTPNDGRTDCDKFPNSVGCTDLGEAPGDEVPTGERDVGYSAEILALPAGCPAPISVNGYSLSFQPACDAAPTVRALLVGIGGVMALMICVAAVRGA